MSPRRSLYEVLGVARDADAATIEAAYHGRSLRFRVGSFDDRPRESTAPTRAEVESAFATLRDPIARARYDAEYFGADLPPAVTDTGGRRTALWIVTGLLVLLAICAVGGLLVAARPKPASGDPIGRILGADTVARATLTARAVTPTALSAGSLTVTLPLPPAAPSVQAPTPATVASLPSVGAITPPAPAVTSTPTPAAPAATAASSPLPALPRAPATATVEPPATELPPAAVNPEPTSTPVPPPPFPATDWVGTSTPVNVRAGPGTNFATLRSAPFGTLLAATGATRTINGVLWREFQLVDGTIGWMRDIDVFPAQ